MQTSTKKLSELHAVISKMPLNECCANILPEFGVRWREVSQAVRNARLPMTCGSVAEVLCGHAARTLTEDDLDDILSRLRLQLIASKPRTWHVIRLLEPTNEDTVTEILRTLHHRVVTALRSGKIRSRPKVQSIMLGDLVYLSIQLLSDNKDSSILYLATPPGEPIALVSSVGAVKLIKACVQGLGFAKYENADLYGKDIPSLLRISNPISNGQADHLTTLPPYEPTPTILNNGIDYTNKSYDLNYVEQILGPNPPILTELNIKSQKTFFDKTLLNKNINLNIKLKSEDVAKSLKSWVVKGGLAANSDFFQIFSDIKANRIHYNGEDSD